MTRQRNRKNENKSKRGRQAHQNSPLIMGHTGKTPTHSTHCRHTRIQHIRTHSLYILYMTYIYDIPNIAKYSQATTCSTKHDGNKCICIDFTPVHRGIEGNSLFGINQKSALMNSKLFSLAHTRSITSPRNI